jgi:hypothetical protein
MKLMTAKDLKRLQHGDKVYRFENSTCRGLDYVGRMPRTERYLIFSDFEPNFGVYLTHLYISPKDETFCGEWYSGEYDSKFVGNLMIEELKTKVNRLEEIYIDD